MAGSSDVDVDYGLASDPDRYPTPDPDLDNPYTYFRKRRPSLASTDLHPKARTGARKKGKRGHATRVAKHHPKAKHGRHRIAKATRKPKSSGRLARRRTVTQHAE
jgi:hypothetical protein